VSVFAFWRNGKKEKKRLGPNGGDVAIERGSGGGSKKWVRWVELEGGRTHTKNFRGSTKGEP